MSDDLRRDRIFPPLPDAEYGTRLIPVEDGLAWKKACEECAGRTSDPQELGGYHQRKIMDGESGTLFYCIHRTACGDDVYGPDKLPLSPVRVCACYGALHPEQATISSGSSPSPT